MDVLITPSSLQGTVDAIPSKSVAHRALICAALADKPTKINNLFPSKDIVATENCLRALFEKKPLPCSESGSTLRFMLPVALAVGGKFEFLMEGKLPERPLSPLREELEKKGAKISQKGKTLYAEGKLESGIYNLRGDVSSQFITGLLLALPLLQGDSEIRIEGELQSAPYVDITRSVQEKFGVYSSFENNTFYIKGGQQYKSATEYTVEGDWSNGAFWYCADALSENEVICTGLDKNSPQGDKEIVNILKNLPCTVDARNIPDLIPAVSAVAALTEGVTTIVGAERLAIKESNRLTAIYDTLTKLGADISATPDGLIIKGRKTLSGGEVQSFNDHRIVMMAAIASIKCTAPVKISGAQAASKSYPHFFEDFKKLGGKIKEEI